jgi:uronate dehydrogenase
MLWSWMSYDDFIRLVTACLTTPRLGHTIAAGLSDNLHKPVNVMPSAHIGYVPQDNTEVFRAAMEARTPVPDPNAPTTRFLGGMFTEFPHPDDKGDE